MAVGKLHRPGLPFANVVAAGVATSQIMVGRTLEVLTLVLGGTAFAVANIANVKIKANGKPIVDASGAQLEKLAEYRGDTVTTHLPIYFADFTGLDSIDQEVGAFDTSYGVVNLTIEVEISGATAPTLRYQTQESISQIGKPYSPLVAKTLRYPYNTATGGRIHVQLPFGPTNGAVIKRIHIEHGVADNVKGVICKQDSNVIHETLAADNVETNKRLGFVPQTKLYTIDFVGTGAMKNAWDTKDARSLELIPEFLAADAGDVIVEYLDPIGNL